MNKKFVKFGRAVFKLSYVSGQTDRQTDRQTDMLISPHNTSHRYRGRSNSPYKIPLMYIYTCMHIQGAAKKYPPVAD